MVAVLGTQLFLTAFPTLHEIIRNNYVWGAASGLGVVNLVMGFNELARALSPPHGDDGDDRAIMICLVTDRRRLSTGPDVRSAG